MKRNKFCQRLVASAEGSFTTATLVFSITKSTSSINDLTEQQISLLACEMRRLYNRSIS